MNGKITANYHTHTRRCMHASGEDREYVEAAIQAGIKILGFSDHTPYPTGTGFVSGMRMPLSAADGYFKSITDLKEEYKKDIEIYAGVEAEYFPEHFHKLVEFLDDYPLDYMIMGEHFVPDEEHGCYVGALFTDKKILDMYVENVIAGMETGRFAYVAHPDLPNYCGDDKEQTMTEALSKICSAAKRLNIPLEINMLGYVRGIQYPSERLLSIAAEHKNDMIIGMDIHNPKHFFNEKAVNRCVEMAEKHGIRLLERLKLNKKTYTD